MIMIPSYYALKQRRSPNSLKQHPAGRLGLTQQLLGQWFLFYKRQLKQIFLKIAKTAISNHLASLDLSVLWDLIIIKIIISGVGAQPTDETIW